MTSPKPNHWLQGLGGTDEACAPDDIERLDRLVERAADGDFAGEVKILVRKVFAAIFAGAGTLDAAFGLQGGPQSRRLSTRLALARRNRLLRETFEVLAQETGESNWDTAGRLAAEIKEFRGSIWIEWCELESPPPGASRLRALLFQVFQAAGGKVPSRVETISRICSN
jgi:hypothetical protein